MLIHILLWPAIPQFYSTWFKSDTIQVWRIRVEKETKRLKNEGWISVFISTFSQIPTTITLTIYSIDLQRLYFKIHIS